MKLLDVLADTCAWYLERFPNTKELRFQLPEAFHEQLRKEANETIAYSPQKLKIDYLSTFTINYFSRSCIIEFEANDIDEGPGNTFLNQIVNIVLSK